MAVCPYHSLAEFAEKIHVKLVDKKIVRRRPSTAACGTVFYVIFALSCSPATPCSRRYPLPASSSAGP